MVGVAHKIDTICTHRGLLGIPGSHLLFLILSIFSFTSNKFSSIFFYGNW